MRATKTPRALEEAQAEFLARWGEFGPAWGVSRTMSRIHALLMVSPDSLNTDEIMAALDVSRGSAHGNLQELCDWGLVRRLGLPGTRKDHFEAEKDVWRVVQLIARQRRRKEVEPVLDVLGDCLDRTKGLKTAEAKAFRHQIAELLRFAQLGDRVLEKTSRLRSASLLTWIARFLR